MEQLEALKTQLGKPYNDLEFLLNCFKEVLEEIGEPGLARHIPWICQSCNFEEITFTQKHFHLFSISFQLLNLAETLKKMEQQLKKSRLFLAKSKFSRC